MSLYELTMAMLGARSVTTLNLSLAGMPAKAWATLAQPMRSAPRSRDAAWSRRAREAERVGALRSRMRWVTAASTELSFMESGKLVTLFQPSYPPKRRVWARAGYEQ